MPNPDVQDDTTEEQASKEARAAGVERMLSGQDPPEEPERNDPDPPREVGGAGKVGESMTRRGEDVAGDKEPGRQDTGTDDTFAQRPYGTSSARDRTGVNPQEPSTDTAIE
jgi:hypothetical protein